MADLQHADCDGLGRIEGCFGVQGEDQADDDADGGDEAQGQDVEQDLGPLHAVVDHLVANLRHDQNENQSVAPAAEQNIRVRLL